MVDCISGATGVIMDSEHFCLVSFMLFSKCLFPSQPILALPYVIFFFFMFCFYICKLNEHIYIYIYIYLYIYILLNVVFKSISN